MPREGFQASGSGMTASAAIVSTPLLLQLFDLELCDAGDEREVIVLPRRRVATLLPAADVAMLARIRIGRAACPHWLPPSSDCPDPAEIGAVVVNAVGLRLVVRMRRYNVAMFRPQALHIGDELGV